MARTYQPRCQRARSARSQYQRAADDAAARDAGEGVRQAAIPNDRADAEPAAAVAGGELPTASTKSTAPTSWPTEARSSAGSRCPTSSRWRSSMRSSQQLRPRAGDSSSFRPSAPIFRSDRHRPISRDWSRMFDDHPYDGPRHRARLRAAAGLDQLRAGLCRSDGLRLRGARRVSEEARRSRPPVMVLLGDRQPPAAVSGEGASWNVPVHVVTSHPALLDRLITPAASAPGSSADDGAVSKMNALLPTSLDVFGGHD